jgi:ElaB/YqjD/DUF883 family membrane-anchored ribosome-binding protein
MTDQQTPPKDGPINQAAAGVAPLAAKAKQFARDRPYTAAAFAGVVGLALLNTLRGR